MAVLTLSEALDRANAGKLIAPTAPKHLKHWERPKDYSARNGRATTQQASANPATVIALSKATSARCSRHSAARARP